MIVTVEHVIVFFLILSRFMGFAASAPIFSNRNLVQPPPGFSTGPEKFNLYINGQFVPSTFYSVVESGGNVSVVIQTGQTEYTLDSGDEVILNGKIE